MVSHVNTASSASRASSAYRMPAEWEPQEATLFSWPDNAEHWGSHSLSALQQKFAQICATISRFQKVEINIAASCLDSARQAILSQGGELAQVEFIEMPHDDVWCRDHGPIIVHDLRNEERVALNWEFNGWGDRFHPYELDNQVPQRYARHKGMRCENTQRILEGGAIEVNGQGLLMTTEAVLLNENRHPGGDDLLKSKSELEADLARFLGVKTILWLNEGLEGDDTGGHIDDLARFTPSGDILAVHTDNQNLHNFGVCSENWRRLREMLTEVPELKNKEIIKLELPEVRASNAEGSRLPVMPASYANYLILNEAVLVPQFDLKSLDSSALSVIGEHFPEREMIGIPASDLVSEGGAIHCISQHIPSPLKSS